MMRIGITTAVMLGALMIVVHTQAGGALKSGPQVGEDVPGPFHPLNVTGESKGKKACLYCSNGGNPVAVVFAREATPAVAKLLKQLDGATLKNAGAQMGSFAVFCSDKEDLDKQLEKLDGDQKLQKLVLAIDSARGPSEYRIAKDAEVTVLLYTEFSVKANHVFRKGELNDAAIARIVDDVPKIAK